MAACCLIESGEVKAYWYDIGKNERINFAADYRYSHSQVQFVKEANIYYLRVIPEDKSQVSCRELRVHLLLHPLLHIGVQIPNS